MKVLRIQHDKKKGIGYFTIWVWARHNLIDWQDCAYGFKYEEGQVYFLFGGQESDKRLIGEAQSKEDAIKEAEVFLEGWLRECGAID